MSAERWVSALIAHRSALNMRIECSACSTTFPADELINLCRNCSGPLLVIHDLKPTPRVASTRCDMWRYRDVLPPLHDSEIVTLGEGCTPLLHSTQFANVWIKDESKNP